MTALRIVLASLLASTALTSASFAQNTQLPTVREYQTPQNERPRTRPLREGVTGFGQTQGVIVDPRFIVEAVNFKAVDESGPNNPGSDEVIAIFRSGALAAVGSEIEDVDTGDVIDFDADQRCISPLVDDDGAYNNEWDCAAAGARGPVAFSVELYELDGPPWRDLFPWTPFCVREENYDDDVYANDRGFGCILRTNADTLFRHEFSYSVPEILSRLDPSCRCFTETARYTEEDWRGDTVYEFTFRITRVDAGGEGPAVDRNPGGGVTPMPVVHRSGTLTAPEGQGFELDAGTVVANGSDFAFSRVFGANALTPGGGAKIWTGNATPRGYATCYAERMSANYVTTQVAAPAVGGHACYVTSDGRVGEFRVTAAPGATLSIAYTTWQ